jgi:hypothetical protein
LRESRGRARAAIQRGEGAARSRQEATAIEGTSRDLGAKLEGAAVGAYAEKYRFAPGFSVRCGELEKHLIASRSRRSVPILRSCMQSQRYALDLTLGCWRSARLLPQHVQRADRRRSLEASPPHLMISSSSSLGLGLSGPLRIEILLLPPVAAGTPHIGRKRTFHGPVRSWGDLVQRKLASLLDW